jgi:hypothetical protein
MASLNTLRTKYGIVLSVLIALVLVAFILGDQLSMRGGQETAEEVELIINGKEIKTKEFQEAYQVVGNEEDVRPYLVYENYYGPELNKIGLSKLDEKGMKRAIVQSMAAEGASREQVNNMLNNLTPALLQFVYAQYAASTAVSESFHLNIADLTAFEGQDKLSFDGRFVRYPYSTIDDSEVSVSDEDVRKYYEAHPLRNNKFGERNLVYVEFPHAVITEEVEGDVAADDAEVPAEQTAVKTDPNSVVADINAFKEAAKGSVEAFRKAAEEAGCVVDEVNGYNSIQLGSQQLYRWAAESPVAAISNFTVEGKSYVVMVESIDENENIPFAEREMDIRTKLINAKKFEILAETMTVGEDAETFEGVKFSDNSRDKHLVGAICASNEVTGNEVKVMGDDAAYVFVVDKVNGDLGDVKSQSVAHHDKNRAGFVQSVSAAYGEKLNVVDPRRQN